MGQESMKHQVELDQPMDYDSKVKAKAEYLRKGLGSQWATVLSGGIGSRIRSKPSDHRMAFRSPSPTWVLSDRDVIFAT